MIPVRNPEQGCWQAGSARLLQRAEHGQLAAQARVLGRQQRRLAARLLVDHRARHDLLGALREAQRGQRLPHAARARRHIGDHHRLAVAAQRVLPPRQLTCLKFGFEERRWPCTPCSPACPSSGMHHESLLQEMQHERGTTTASTR